jgi:hypothetical protein
MRSLNPAAATAATQLHHLVMEFAAELDHNNGQTIDELYTEDGLLYMGARPIEGRAAILGFYKERLARLAVEQKDGVRTSRHVFTNVRVRLDAEDRATVDFISVQYAGEGKPPIMGLTAPTSVADCKMLCRLEADGAWRVAQFSGEPCFLAGDPFLAKSLGRS